MATRRQDEPGTDCTDGKTLGVVIPAYGHPQFLAEAVISACSQDCAGRVVVVVVDDGCRFKETEQTVVNLMQRYPGALYYLRQKNTRLPGARNAGVRFLMELEPGIDSIFFLDADNRIEPYSLRQYREVLGEDVEIGWAYPDIAFFGLSWGAEGFDIRETARDYSLLKHLRGNISEAGSLVRADMFRKGVFYDETMRHGFEDWDFWLTALGAGFRGRRVQHAGFLYRRRPESMLADSRRQEEALISRLRQKHAALFAPRQVMALEHEEAPAFGIVSAETGQALLTSDPLREGKSLDADEFLELVRRWHAGQKEHFFPDHIIVMSDAQWSQMQEQKPLLRWFFWAIKEAGVPYQRWLLEERGYPYHEGLSPETPIVGNMVLQVTAEGLSGLLAAKGEVGLPTFSPFVFQSPEPLVSGHGKSTYTSLLARLGEIVDACRTEQKRVRHAGRRYAGPAVEACRRGLIDEICAEENRRPYPAATKNSRTLIAVDQDTLLDELQRAAFINFLQQVSLLSDEILLVVERGEKRSLAAVGIDEWLPIATDFVMLDRVPGGEEYRMYLGRRIYSLFTLKAKEDGALLARSVDRIVVYGPAAFLEVLGDARRFGVKGYVYLDRDMVNSLAEAGSVGAKILAFEHAEELVVCDNQETAASLSAQGFPPGKFIRTDAFFEMLAATGS